MLAVLTQYRRSDWVVLRGSDKISEEHFSEFLSYLPRFDNVSKFVLTGRLQGPTLSERIFPYLTANLRSLRHLDLSHNLLYPAQGKALADALLLQQNTQIEVLKVSDNPLGNTGAMHLLEAVTGSNVVTLKVLDLSRCSLTDAGAETISPRLRGARFETPFYINLSHNHFGPHGLCVLGRGLPGKVSLSVVGNQARRPYSGKKKATNDDAANTRTTAVAVKRAREEDSD
eukprot:PhM_4_TR17148/c0_g1_i1/m.75328